MNTKLIEVLKSKNFLVSLGSLVLLGLGYNNIDTGMTAEGWYNLFTSSTGTQMLSTIALLVLNTASKILASIKEKTFSFAFLKSSNFIAGFSVIVSLVVSSFLGEQVAGIVVSGVIIVANILLHFLQPAKQKVVWYTLLNKVVI